MYTRKRYSIKNMILWTRIETSVFILLAVIPVLLYETLGLAWLQLPWLPIALVGTAVAFIVGFQNNVAYDRIWEARKIWGGIVNTSRTWAMMCKDMVTHEYAQEPAAEADLKEAQRVLIYRHIAWLTALRHAMRQSRPWEVSLEHRTNREWSDIISAPEWKSTLEEDLKPLLSKEEYQYVLQKTNKSATLLSLQSRQLRELKEKGWVWEFSFLELEGILKELFDLQGKSERIKNFPYPRQYASLNSYFVWVFICFLPFGVIPEFAALGEKMIDQFPLIGEYFVWCSIPFTAMVSWIFHTMERIGRTGENPFEGSANDVPISTISRGIEIDLREMIDEDKSIIPEPLEAVYDVQM